MPRISVIVPVYKVEKYLNRCVDSILAQTFRDFELILVNDGSPDKCPEICDEYAMKDSRVRVIHQENAGVSVARNRGIAYAIENKFDWITFIDSDDWVNETFLEDLYQAAKQTNARISVGNMVTVYSNGRTSRSKVPYHNIQGITTSRLFVENQVLVEVCWAKLYDTRIFKELDIRFPKNMRYEDTAIVHQIVLPEEVIAVCPAEYYYYQREDSQMNSEWTPDKMLELEVSELQLQWIVEHNYTECIRRAVVMEFIKYARHLKQIGNKKNQKYVSIIRKKARNMLRKYGKNCNISIDNCPFAYEIAYPRTMAVYWLISSQINKFKKRKKKNATN